MVYVRTSGLYNLHSIIVIASYSLSFWLYLLLLLNVPFGIGGLTSLSHYFAYNAAGAIPLWLSLQSEKRSGINLISIDGYRKVQLAFWQTASVVLGISLLGILTYDNALSRLFLFSYLPILFGVLLFSNAVMPKHLCRWVFGNSQIERSLLIGSSRKVARLKHWIKEASPYGMKIVGLVTDEAKAATPGAIPVLGPLSEFMDIVHRENIHSVILLQIPESRSELLKIIAECNRNGIRLTAINSLPEFFHHRLIYYRSFEHDFVAMRKEPLQDPLNRAIKRLIDLVTSLSVILLVLPPVCLVVLIAQRLQSPGPLFFRQTRSGIQKHNFELIKFRTMNVNNEGGSRQAARNDGRTYPFGRLLRMSSLDELPQFLNVLKGEMSSVGPRPHMIEHDAEFSSVLKDYPVRSYIKPGITGLAQVRGLRGETAQTSLIRRRVKCDIEYIERWSALLDIIIIFRTAFQVIKPPKSAY